MAPAGIKAAPAANRDMDVDRAHAKRAVHDAAAKRQKDSKNKRGNKADQAAAASKAIEDEQGNKGSLLTVRAWG